MTSTSTSWVNKSLENGRFLVKEQLGEGGMGVVYKGWDQANNREIVIKVPKLTALEDKTFLKRFARENKTLKALRHPHIVSILHVGEHDGWPFTVLQFLSGGDLESRLKASGGRLPVANISKWLPPIAEALDFIHGKGYLHRDVKPSNILFDEDGCAYLADFGIAKVLSDQATKATKLTGTGMVLGTPDYMAPELIMGQPIDGGVDQYALATTIYECLSGKPPFSAPTPAALLVMHAMETIPPLDDSTAEPVSQVVLKALAKKPQDRYATCSAFANQLLKAIKQEKKPGGTAKNQIADSVRNKSETTSATRGFQETTSSDSPQRPKRSTRSSRRPTSKRTRPPLRGKRGKRKRSQGSSAWMIGVAMTTIVGLCGLGILMYRFLFPSSDAPKAATKLDSPSAEIASPPRQASQISAIETPSTSTDETAGGVGRSITVQVDETNDPSTSVFPTPNSGPPIPSDSTNPSIRALSELNTTEREQGLWVSPDGLRIYLERQATIYVAERRNTDSPFGPENKLVEGRHPTLTADELTMILLVPREKGRGESMRIARRSNRTAPFSTPNEIPELSSVQNPKTPFVSPDGLTLVFVRFGSPGFFVSTRPTASADWSSPTPLRMTDVRQGEKLSWPFLLKDGLTLIAADESESGAGHFFLWTRSNTKAAFANRRGLKISGISEIFGRSPVYVEDIKALFFTSTRPRKFPRYWDQQKNGDWDFWLVDGVSFP